MAKEIIIKKQTDGIRRKTDDHEPRAIPHHIENTENVFIKPLMPQKKATASEDTTLSQRASSSPRHQLEALTPPLSIQSNRSRTQRNTTEAIPISVPLPVPQPVAPHRDRSVWLETDLSGLNKEAKPQAPMKSVAAPDAQKNELPVVSIYSAQKSKGHDIRGGWFAFPKSETKHADRAPQSPESHSGMVINGTEEKTFSGNIGTSSGRRIHFNEFSGWMRRPAVWGVLTGVCACLAALILASTVFAKATITMKPKIESIVLKDIRLSFDVNVSEVNKEERRVPAERLSFVHTSQEEVAAGGRKYVEQRARGQVYITNSFSTAPQKLVAHTRFITASGTIFRLPASIVIPGAKMEKGVLIPQDITAELVADQPGEQSNTTGVVKLKIVGFRGTVKYDGFYATAKNGFSGGIKGEQAVARSEDIQQAQQQASRRVYDEIKQMIAQKIPQGFVSSDGLSEIQIIKVETTGEGARPGYVSVRATASADVLIFRADDVQTVLRHLLVREDSGSQAFIEDEAILEYERKSIDVKRGRADVAVQGYLKTKTILSAEKEKELIEDLKGKKEGSARDILEKHNEFNSITISIFPPWRATIPDDGKKIHFIADRGGDE